MVTRLCEQQTAIAAVLHCKRNLHHLELSPQEWHNMEDIVKLLEPFKNATEVLSGQKYPTPSCLAPILKDLRDKLIVNADDSSVLKTAKSVMLKDFDNRYQSADVQLLMNKAAFLDPRFKKFLHFCASYLSTTQLSIVSLSLTEEMEGLLQQQRAESSTLDCDNTESDTQIMGVSQADSEKPPQKSRKRYIP